MVLMSCKLLLKNTSIPEWYIRGVINKFRDFASTVRKGWLVFAWRWGYELAFNGMNWCKFRPATTFGRLAISRVVLDS